LGREALEYSGELGEEPYSGMLENISPSVRERLARLSRENKQLKANVGITKIRARLGREALSTAESWVRSRTAVCWRTSRPL
jgi:hypothetical protein